jgi:hypothetical protein
MDGGGGVEGKKETRGGEGFFVGSARELAAARVFDACLFVKKSSWPLIFLR